MEVCNSFVTHTFHRRNEGMDERCSLFEAKLQCSEDREGAKLDFYVKSHVS